MERGEESERGVDSFGGEWGLVEASREDVSNAA